MMQNNKFDAKTYDNIPQKRQPNTFDKLTVDQKREIQPWLGQPVPKTGQQPLVDLQVYEPAAKPMPKQADPALYAPISTINPLQPGQVGPLYAQTFGPYPPQPYGYVPNYMPVIKNYNISVGGPDADHVRVANIFEDVLPNRGMRETFNSLSERMTTCSFIRSVLIRNSDGENIDLDGKSNNSLLSYIKFLGLNPYRGDSYNKNPYLNLPSGMLIYRSCYPIRYDQGSSSVICAKDSVGVNVRIYKMSIGELNARKIRDINPLHFDLWREIEYYAYVRENIIKKNVCPNFCIMYSYFINEKCTIDFNKVAIARGEKIANEPTYLNPPPINALNDAIQRQRQQTQINPKAYSGSALLALTESPTYNLYDWMSRTYDGPTNVKSMVGLGFHDDETWKTVLFQILVSMYVLQLNNIAFVNFTLKDSVYIKDLDNQNGIGTYWRYKINGIDYYIPNYGYLVMVDSNYKDINGQTNNTQQKKILSTLFGDNNEIIYNTNFDLFKNNINNEIFASASDKSQITPPGDKVLSLIKAMHDEAISPNPVKDISHYIEQYMTNYMNNRIGTYLVESEIMFIRKDDKREMKRGQIIVMEVEYETYMFVLCLGKQSDKIEIFCRENPESEIIKKSVNRELLYNYSISEPISQTFKPGTMNFNEESLIETYVINKN